MSATETRSAVDNRPRFEGAWETKRLGTLLTRPATYGIVKAGPFLPTGIPMLRSGEIRGGVIRGDLPLVSQAISDQYQRTILKTGDIVVALVGYPGEAAVVPAGLEGANISRAVGLVRLQDGTDAGFLVQYLNSTDGRRRFLTPGAGSAQMVVNLGDLNRLALPAPPLPEQRAIAAALSDVDDLLQSLDCLIAKKRDVKQGAMQQLLTGTTRLPGFEGAWETKRLGEVLAHCSSGATPSRSVPGFFQGNVPWVNSGDLNYETISSTEEQITQDAVAKTNLKIHPPGTFLIAITGLEAKGTRGSCGILGIHASTNQSCMALIPDEQAYSKYLFHWYVLNGNDLAFQYCQGTKQQSYTAGIVKKIPIYLPKNLTEQRAIAAVLSDMDAEIDALEARREKVAAIKQGMMQELLTGRTRLPIPQEGT